MAESGDYSTVKKLILFFLLTGSIHAAAAWTPVAQVYRNGTTGQLYCAGVATYPPGFQTPTNTPTPTNTFTPTNTPTATATPTQTALTFLGNTSSEKSVASDQDWLQMTGNSVTLTAGTWLVHGQIIFSNNGSDADYDNLSYVVSTANGADDANMPTAVSTTGNVTLKAGITSPEGAASDAGFGDGVFDVSTADIVRKYNKTTQTVAIAVSANTEIFLVPYVDSAGTATNGRVITNIWAQKISDRTS